MKDFNIGNNLNLTDALTVLQPAQSGKVFFPSTCGTFTKICPMLVLKASLNKFQSEIIQNMFSEQSGIKVDINNKKITRNSSNIWKLRNILLNNQ